MDQGSSLLTFYRNKTNCKKFQSQASIGNKSFTRKRKLPFSLVYSMIFQLVKKSLAIECELLEPTGDMIPPSKQAFSKARYKISHTGFQEFLEDSLAGTYTLDPKYGCWRGYRVIGADGSSLRLPDTPEIVEIYGRFKPNGTDGTMPPLGRVSLFVDLCTSMICSARLASWDIGEQSLAEEQLPEVVEKMRALKQDKLLFLYDRGYPSLKFIHQHNTLGVDFVFRLQRGMYKSLWRRVEQGETDFNHVIETRGGTPEEVRVIALTLHTGEVEVLITSLFCRQLFSWNDITRIYTLRWHIEECYKRLKISAELENFSGNRLEAVLQEFWAHLVMCNILSLHMCDAKGPWDPDNIPETRLNFSVLFGLMKVQFQQIMVGNINPERFQKLFKRAANRAKVKIRPGRSFSRDKVGKPKRHHVFRRVC